jgi:DNA-binding LacI/PurR family transcriptional regulator
MVSMLEGNKVDGIILCSRIGDASIYTCKYAGNNASNYAGKTMPIVSIDRNIEGFSTVTSDNYYGGTLAAKELYEVGCKHPVLFGNKMPEYMSMNYRYVGFSEECKKLGLNPQYIWTSEALTDEDTLVQCFLKGMEQYQDADGLFITSDAIAAKIVCNQEVRNNEIIDRLPMISYDGLEISKLLNITTVAQPIYEMGVCATEQLIRRIEGKVMYIRSVLPVQLIERDSTSKFKHN